ncbi:hypothetical protein BJX62DRAFT_61612 [Aspergillus germanicus]
MALGVLARQSPTGTGLEKALIAMKTTPTTSELAPIPLPPSDLPALQEEGHSLMFSSFTTEDALELGHLLYARLAPLASETPAVVSITLANSGQVLFQCVTGPGTTADNEHWIRRKRNTTLRFGASSWFMHCKFQGDEGAFAAKYSVGNDEYAIHGGAVPIYVRGVEGVVAVVVVSGLAQHEDHAVIFDVVKENWR